MNASAMNGLARVAHALTGPEQSECFVLQRLPVSFNVRWLHNTLASAQAAKELAESEGMAVRILRVSLACEVVS